MARMDEAPTPDILYTETVNGSIVTPASGNQKLFVDTDHLLKLKNSSGTVTGISGMANVLTTTGDIIYSSSGTTAARLAVGTAVQVLHGGASVPAYSAVVEGDLSTSDITTANATTSKHGFTPKYPNDATKYLDGTGAYTVPAGSGGSTIPVQETIIAYPTAASGDDDLMTSTAGWTQVGAQNYTTFSSDAVTAISIYTNTGSQTCNIRKTLGTTKAAAFDFRMALLPVSYKWSANYDTLTSVYYRTSGGTIIGGFDIAPFNVGGAVEFFRLRSFGNAGSVLGGTTRYYFPYGSPINLRVTRDGSNALLFWFALGSTPFALTPMLDTSNNGPTTGTSSGTVARVEVETTTPAGPSGTSLFGAKLDWFQSV